MVVRRKEEENAELRQEMKAIAERIAEEKAGRAAALRKLMSSIPLQADASRYGEHLVRLLSMLETSRAPFHFLPAPRTGPGLMR